MVIFEISHLQSLKKSLPPVKTFFLHLGHCMFLMVLCNLWFLDFQLLYKLLSCWNLVHPVHKAWPGRWRNVYFAVHHKRANTISTCGCGNVLK